MATYASTTNPFIKSTDNKTTNSDNGKRIKPGYCVSSEQNRQNKKNAPGMARPQNQRAPNGRREKRRLVRRHDKTESGQDLPLGASSISSVFVNETKDISISLDSIELNNNTEGELNSSNENTQKIINNHAPATSNHLDELNQLQEVYFNSSLSCPKSPNVEDALIVKSCDSEIDAREDLLIIERLSVTNCEHDRQEKEEKEHSTSEKMEVKTKSGAHENTKDNHDDDDDEYNDEINVVVKASTEPSKETDSRRHRHLELIKKLRLQLRDLERYAYERGELEKVPTSVLAERHTVILETLMKKLPLNLDADKLERLELDELKFQVNKEISELLDPLLTKEHLLDQLKSQLTDLEKYIAHLHRTLGVDKRTIDCCYDRSGTADCSCSMYGCSSKLPSSVTFQSLAFEGQNEDELKLEETATTSSLLSNDTLPKTSRLIRGLMAQLICSDIKIQEAMKMEKDYSKYLANDKPITGGVQRQDSPSSSQGGSSGAHRCDIMNRPVTKSPQFHDSAVWAMHIDRVILATNSLTNLYLIESENIVQTDVRTAREKHQVDESLVDSVVRRQLVPALKDLLAYGLIDPNSVPRSSYRSLLFDPYYLISSLTCLPGSQSSKETSTNSLPKDKVHVWDVIEDYFKTRNEIEFSRSSSIKTLSQSFNLTPSLKGPLKVTSKQALLIAVDDISERLTRCKPNGPESHFKLFVYVALNQGKLATWLRIIFRNKSILRQYYHSFSFVCQPEKMDKFLSIIEVLCQIEFKLNIDTDSSTNRFVSAF